MKRRTNNRYLVGASTNVHRTAVYEALQTNDPEKTATIAAVDTL